MARETRPKEDRTQVAVITSISKYTPENIRSFTRSLRLSGFTGRKIAAVFTAETNTLRHLETEGFEVYSPRSITRTWGIEHKHGNGMPKENVFSDRFLSYAEICRQLDEETRVLTCDCRDLVFQESPERALRTLVSNKGKRIVCSQEGARIKDEKWCRDNMKDNYVELYDWVKDNGIANAGVIGGMARDMEDLCATIYLASLGGRKHSYPRLTSTDQSAYNLIIRQREWRRKTVFTDNSGTWACQVGTYLAVGKEEYWDKDMTPREKDGLVYNSTGVPYTIVHQYDRFAKWKDAIERRYN